jgi:hypothetical protein
MKRMPSGEPFATIDDCITLAHELSARLNKLGEYKHPLDVRRGVRKEVVSVRDAQQGTQVRAGSKTYFFDVETTKEGKRYLRITESRFKGEGKDHERSRIVVFPEHGWEFAQAVTEMVPKLG